MYKRHKYKETDAWDQLPDPIGMKKWDGAAYYMSVGPTGSLQFFSRRPSVKGGFPEKAASIPHISSTPLPQFAGDVYHVELVHTGPTKTTTESHSVTSGILNSLSPKAIETQRVTGPVRAVLLDVIHPKLGTFKEKREYLDKVQKAVNKPDLLFLPEAKIGADAINREIERTKNNNEEGVIVTSLSLPETENVRIKIKHKKLYNLKVVGITQEIDIHGNKKESAGALVVADRTGRVVGNVGTGLTKDLRREIWVNPKAWMEKLIQVEAMDPTGSTNRKLRSPVYNGDADGGLDLVE